MHLAEAETRGSDRICGIRPRPTISVTPNSFGLRQDKDPSQVSRERPADELRALIGNACPGIFGSSQSVRVTLSVWQIAGFKMARCGRLDLCRRLYRSGTHPRVPVSLRSVAAEWIASEQEAERLISSPTKWRMVPGRPRKFWLGEDE